MLGIPSAEKVPKGLAEKLRTLKEEEDRQKQAKAAEGLRESLVLVDPERSVVA